LARSAQSATSATGSARKLHRSKLRLRSMTVWHRRQHSLIQAPAQATQSMQISVTTLALVLVELPSHSQWPNPCKLQMLPRSSTSAQSAIPIHVVMLASIATRSRAARMEGFVSVATCASGSDTRNSARQRTASEHCPGHKVSCATTNSGSLHLFRVDLITRLIEGVVPRLR